MENDSKISAEPKQFICDFIGCNKVFKAKGNLKTHYNIHVKLKYKTRVEKNLISVGLKIVERHLMHRGTEITMRVFIN
jgi:uncharacterized Zn-finger protein